MRTAYLVVHVDLTNRPPTLTSAGIYSESANSLTGACHPGRAWAFDVIQIEGKDFEDARRRVKELITNPIFNWVLKLPDGFIG